jgi:hypothetical protein
MDGAKPLLVVSLLEEEAVADGRRWSVADYQARDAALAALGVGSFRKPPALR